MRYKRVLPSLILLAGLLFLPGCGVFILCQVVGPVGPKPIYAVEIVEAQIRLCESVNQRCNPILALGPPDESFVSLGKKGGYIIVKMAKPFTNGPGADLRIYEIGRFHRATQEPFDVFISDNGMDWIQVADDITDDEGKAYAAIRLAPNAPSESYQYIKVVDESPINSVSPGSDIDAIEALYALGHQLSLICP